MPLTDTLVASRAHTVAAHSRSRSTEATRWETLQLLRRQTAHLRRQSAMCRESLMHSQDWLDRGYQLQCEAKARLLVTRNLTCDDRP
jgi:hypothetical protein